MKKHLSILFFLVSFFSVTSNAQIGQTWEVCYDTFPSIQHPGQDSLVARECWEITIINNLHCDLDFFWDYSCHQCGDITPAVGPAPDYNLVKGSANGGSGAPVILRAYELKWSCGDNPVTCVCPCWMKFRVGNPSINPSDPFVPEPWPMLSALQTANGITYMTSINCNGTTININVQVNGNQATFTFF